jgi:AbrB family looped-hinge helix DNA binding protein
MKATRTKKTLERHFKNRQRRILAEAFGTDRERIKPFSEDDRGEDRSFSSSPQGLRHREKRHEASMFPSKMAAIVTLDSKGRITIPREMRTPLNIKPGQLVDVTEKDGVVYIVPIRQLRRSERQLKGETERNVTEAVLINEKLRRKAHVGWDNARVIRKWRDRT